MDTLAGFIEMGGYAAFVWPSYIVTALVMAGLLIDSRRSMLANEAALKALQAEEGREGREREEEKPLEAQA